MTEQGDTLGNAFPGPDDDRPDTLPRSWNRANAGQFYPSMAHRCWRDGTVGVCNQPSAPASKTGLCAIHLDQLRSK